MSGLLLHEAVLTYLEDLDNQAPAGTVRGYKSVLLRMCNHFPADRKYAGVKSKDLAVFLYGRGGLLVGKSKGTGTTYRSALRAFFRYGHLMGWGPDVVVPLPAIKPRDKPKPRPTRLGRAQLRLLLDCASDDKMLRAMLAVAMNTALRISDIRKIKLKQLNWLAGDLDVQLQKTQVNDELPITLDLEEELRPYLTWISSQVPMSAETYIFPARKRVGSAGFGRILYDWDPERHVSKSVTHDKLAALYKKTGIVVEEGEAWHVIRRSVARIYFDDLREEMSHDHALRQTASLLGHRNTATTEGYLGMDAERRARNESLRGKRFINVFGNGDVVPIRSAEG
jgi:integrase